MIRVSLSLFQIAALSLMGALSFGFSKAQARDEDWLIFQLRKRLGTERQIFAEYIRRDRSEFLDKRFFELYRLSWGQKSGDWLFLLGGAVIDFEASADESRAHQFAFHGFSRAEAFSGFVRIGLEQRKFKSDDTLYWRLRNRLHLNLLPESAFGPSIYDEVFYVPNGKNRFAEGFNENRFGVGLRYVKPAFEAYLFYTITDLKTVKGRDQVEWLQLQTVFNF